MLSIQNGQPCMKGIPATRSKLFSLHYPPAGTVSLFSILITSSTLGFLVLSNKKLPSLFTPPDFILHLHRGHPGKSCRSFPFPEIHSQPILPVIGKEVSRQHSASLPIKEKALGADPHFAHSTRVAANAPHMSWFAENRKSADEYRITDKETRYSNTRGIVNLLFFCLR